MINHPALTENLFKEIPKLPAARISSVSSNFGLAEVKDFNPEGDRVGKSIQWPNISRAVLARDNYECRICGKSSLSQVDSESEFRKIHFELEVHHIIPRKDGGSDTFQNLITLCEECHHKTFSNGYSGVPVSKDMDLFSFGKSFYFALPPDHAFEESLETRSATLEDYDRVFDQNENRYRVVTVPNARMKLTVASVRVDDYRRLVSDLLLEHDVADFITLNALVSGHKTKVRVLLDSRSDLLV